MGKAASETVLCQKQSRKSCCLSRKSCAAEMEGMQNGPDQRIKPPLLPKPSRFKSGKTEPCRFSSPKAARLQIYPSPPAESSPTNASVTCSLDSTAPCLADNPATTAAPTTNSAHKFTTTTITTTAGTTINVPSCYSEVTLVSSSPVPDSPVSTGAGNERRISCSTTSSEPTPSPSGSLRPTSRTSIRQHMPPHPLLEEEDFNHRVINSVYPSPVHTVDSKTICLSPPSVRDIGSESLSLHKLVEKHSQSFPLQIKVVHGCNGQTPQLSLASGDYYNIHFVKHQEVVSMTDKLGLQYTIPLNSSFQFGLVYSDDPNTHQSQIYEKVGHLVSLSPLPKVICPTRDVGNSEDKNAISAGEILVIKRVIRPKLRRKSLAVLSLKTQTIKTLPLDCEGHFSLSPKKNQMYLLELVRCVPDVFPCKAKMFLSSDAASNSQRTSHSLLHAVVTLTGQKTETSLIASPVTFTAFEDQNGETGAQVNEHLVDIPVDDRLSDVAVLVVDTTECGLQEMLNFRTRTLFETFDVTRVKSWYDPMSDDMTQSLLYATIGRGSEGMGIRVDKPMGAFTRYAPFVAGDSAEKYEALYETVYSPSMERRQSPTYHLGHSNEVAAQYEQPSTSHRVFLSTSLNETASLPPAAKINDSITNPTLHPLHSDPKPISVRRSLQHSKSHYTLPPSDLFMTDCYEDMQATVTSPPTRPAPITSREGTDSKLEQLMATTASLQTQLSQLTLHVSAMQEQLKEVVQMNVVMKRLLEGVSALTLPTSQLRGAQGVYRGRNSAVLAPTSAREAQILQNRHYLDSLDTAQV